jgi:hypothetical protein
MGREPSGVPSMEQAALDVTPTRTTYTFTGGGVQLRLSFLTPLLPDDLDVLTRPATYVTWSATSSDGKPHEVSAMLAAGADLCVNTPDQSVVARRETVGEMTALVLGSEAQPILRSKGDDHRIDWGFLYVTAPGASGQAIGNANTLAKSFADSGKLPAKDDARFPRPVKEGLPAAAVRDRARQSRDGQADREARDPRVRRSVLDPVHEEEPAAVLASLTAPTRGDDRRCGKGLLAARRARREVRRRAHCRRQKIRRRAVRPDLRPRPSSIAGRAEDRRDANGMPLSFSKENFSNGCIATVDVFYPQLPHFLLMNPTLAKAALVPLLEYSLSPRWRFDFAPHDLGTYPQANGQVYGGGERTEENQMPVEETGNMLILIAAVAKIDGNADFANKYWPVLSKWAKYLEAKGFDPENQLCTDDFAGHLAHNTNLSIKATMGLRRTRCSPNSAARRTKRRASAPSRRLRRPLGERGGGRRSLQARLRQARHVEPEVQPRLGQGSSASTLYRSPSPRKRSPST